ncbi:cathepsin L1-like [Anneissia japonica]|uniref:cathepsin L1-like n=1 Tax=Anneissia japonica TaxID=1529436 RepID=UPI0014255106|nr:cathepsin L1-like [Anneissia japonica]
MKLFVCVLLFGAALAMPNAEWELFKRAFDRAYTAEEEAYRRTVFEDNQKFIQKHNAEYAQGIHTHTVGINEFADLTNAEFVAFFNGYLMVNKTRGSAYLEPSNYEAPATVDWRNKGFVTPVKNQKQCGSCWAFSTTGSLEGQHFKKYMKLVSLSEQQLVDCSQAYGNNGCEGGLMDNAFRYIKAKGGIESEEGYTYTARDGKCKFEANLVVATDTGFTDIESGSEKKLKSAVATVGPISVAMDASHQSFQLYKNGVYSEPRCSSTRLDHGVLAVGYGEDSESGESYWLIKNSWGTTWGMEGYFKITRKGNMCGIATQASYPLV